MTELTRQLTQLEFERGLETRLAVDTVAAHEDHFIRFATPRNLISPYTEHAITTLEIRPLSDEQTQVWFVLKALKLQNQKKAMGFVTFDALSFGTGATSEIRAYLSTPGEASWDDSLTALVDIESSVAA